jgi:hypothetical protein
LQILNQDRRAERLQKIRLDIERYGHTITLITGGPLPRYAYTIGLRDAIGFELIMPGVSRYTAREVQQIVNTFGAALRADPTLSSLEMPSTGSFTLRPAHDSWVRSLALGALDFYSVDILSGAQIVPDADHQTIDVPNMEQDWTQSCEPVWQWLVQPWEYNVPENSIATTNLAALQGSPITELARWEEDQWEMFAGPGPDVKPSEVRVVPLGILVAHDPSLAFTLAAGIGDGYWRESADSDWHEWKRRS